MRSAKFNGIFSKILFINFFFLRWNFHLGIPVSLSCGFYSPLVAAVQWIFQKVSSSSPRVGCTGALWRSHMWRVNVCYFNANFIGLALYYFFCFVNYCKMHFLWMNALLYIFYYFIIVSLQLLTLNYMNRLNLQSSRLAILNRFIITSNLSRNWLRLH